MRIINVMLAVGPSMENQWPDGRAFISSDPPRRPVSYLPRSADAELVFPQQPMRRHVWRPQLNAELKARTIDIQQAQNNGQAIKTQVIRMTDTPKNCYGVTIGRKPGVYTSGHYVMNKPMVLVGAVIKAVGKELLKCQPAWFLG